MRIRNNPNKSDRLIGPPPYHLLQPICEQSSSSKNLICYCVNCCSGSKCSVEAPSLCPDYPHSSNLNNQKLDTLGKQQSNIETMVENVHLPFKKRRVDKSTDEARDSVKVMEVRVSKGKSTAIDQEQERRVDKSTDEARDSGKVMEVQVSKGKSKAIDQEQERRVDKSIDEARDSGKVMEVPVSKGKSKAIDQEQEKLKERMEGKMDEILSLEECIEKLILRIQHIKISQRKAPKSVGQRNPFFSIQRKAPESVGQRGGTVHAHLQEELRSKHRYCTCSPAGGVEEQTSTLNI